MARQKKQIKIIFLADTHLGFDYPLHPRVKRRQRGDAFFENYKRILNYAREIQADLIIHGGDLFFRSRVPEKIVDLTYKPLMDVADAGIPVFIVPGNHERGVLPRSLFMAHPNIFVFSKPRTFIREVHGIKLALIGFPFNRGDVRGAFGNILAETNYQQLQTDVKLLCMHQAVEGAVVGPADFTFRNRKDTIRMVDIPLEMDAVLSGHIHRHQILLPQKPEADISPPVIYAGSIERTAFAEKDEAKGFVEISCSKSGLDKIEFIKLPARPMYDLFIEDTDNIAKIELLLQNAIADLDQNAIVRLNCVPNLPGPIKDKLNTAFFREHFPETMNIQLGSGFYQKPAEKIISVQNNYKNKLVDRIKKEVSDSSGVYLFRSENQLPIYIGKSVKLKQRMLSYFYPNSKQSESRTQQMIYNIRDFSFVEVETELLALLLEDYLIKIHLPDYNIRQQEFNDYRYLLLSNDPFPTLKILHYDDLLICKGTVFGPFRNKYFINDLLSIIYRHIHLRQCDDAHPFRKSLNFDLGQCKGPCRGEISKAQYADIVQRVIDFLGGDEKYLVTIISDKMQKYSEHLEYEQAAVLKKEIEFCQNFSRRQRFINRFKKCSLVIHEQGNSGARYNFSKGKLINAKIGRRNILHAQMDLNLFQAADLRYLMDRANIVYQWLNRPGNGNGYWT